MKSFINQIQPWIGEEESEQLLRVIESTFVTEHNLTREFEAKVRDLTGSKHAIAMTNGTVALFCEIIRNRSGRRSYSPRYDIHRNFKFCYNGRSNTGIL